MKKNIQQRLRRFAALAAALLFLLAFAACGDESSGSNTGGGDIPAVFMTMIGKDGSGNDVTIIITHTEAAALSAYVPASGDFYTVLRQGAIIDKGKVNVPAGGTGSAVFTPAVTSASTFSITLNNWTVTSSASITITCTVGSPGTITVTISSVNNGSGDNLGLDGEWIYTASDYGDISARFIITNNAWEQSVSQFESTWGPMNKGTLSVSGLTITFMRTHGYTSWGDNSPSWEEDTTFIWTGTLAANRLSFSLTQTLGTGNGSYYTHTSTFTKQ